MKHPPAPQSVTFDYAAGRVRLGEDDTSSAVVVPIEALAALVKAAGEVATVDAGRAMGRLLGARVAAHVKGGANGVRDESVESIANVLAGELAVAGLGALSLERWGRALVVALDEAPAVGDSFLAAVIEGLLAAATARELRAVPLARDGGRLRVLVGNTASIERASGLLSGGAAWGDVIVKLHARASSEAS